VPVQSPIQLDLRSAHCSKPGPLRCLKAASKSRLDRDFNDRLGARAYAAEELIAAFLCAEFGFDIRDEGNPLPGSRSPRKQSAKASQIIRRDQRAARHCNIESHEAVAPRRRASGFVSCIEFVQRPVPVHRLDIGIVPDRELRQQQGERTGASARASAAEAPMTRPAAGPWLAVAVQVAAARKVQRLAAT
jgi:hypothetical protein